MPPETDRRQAADPTLYKLQRYVREQMNGLADALATGAALSWDEYRYMVGKVEAFALVERELLDIDIEQTKQSDEV